MVELDVVGAKGPLPKSQLRSGASLNHSTAAPCGKLDLSKKGHFDLIVVQRGLVIPHTDGRHAYIRHEGLCTTQAVLMRIPLDHLPSTGSVERILNDHWPGAVGKPHRRYATGFRYLE
jgi:hypothetical protein